VKYRDIRYVIPFMVQLWLFITPVIYPTSIAKNYSWILYLNPMAGIIESFRACILGHKPIPWLQFALSAILTISMFLIGFLYFSRMEREFADVV
jgi:lipopolysaccharide transport system permease protein